MINKTILQFELLATCIAGWFDLTYAQPPRSTADVLESRKEADKRRINELIPGGPTGTVIEGNVVVTLEGTPQISTSEGLMLPVSNPEVLEKLPRDITSQFTLVREGEAVRVDKADLKVLSNWKQSKQDFPQNRFNTLHRSFGDLESTVERLMQTGAMGAQNEELQIRIDRTSAETVEAFRNVSASDARLREELCERFGELRDLRLKARFGRDDNYWPEVYQKIYENARTAVAISRKGQATPFGSGVLIGKSLVLTCRHVAKKHDVQQLEVWFDYEQTSGGHKTTRKFPVKAFVFEGKQADQGTNPLDFSLLELGPNIDGGHAHQEFKGAELATTELARDDAIYVIGHPNQHPRMVHDNAFVLFPFRVNDFGMTELQMIVCAETQSSPNSKAELNQFLSSYVKSPGAEEYRLFSEKWNKSPVIAADCDTYHGNSGSGAWERKSGLLVGILFAGEYDHGESYTAGWRRHEAILPISMIITQLDESLPDWKANYEVVLK